MDFEAIQDLGMGLIIPAIVAIGIGAFVFFWLMGKMKTRAVKQRIKRIRPGGQVSDYELPVIMGCCIDHPQQMAWYWDNDGQYTPTKGNKDIMFTCDYSAIPLYPGKTIDRTQKVREWGLGGHLTKLAENVWRMKANFQTKRALEEKNQELWKIAIGGLILIILIMVVAGLFKSGSLSLPALSCGGP